MISLSIVIPAYNVADCIPRTLNSILSQNSERVEIIVVDDGATDNTAQVVQRVLDEAGARNAVLYRKDNGGVSSARNFGFGKATGEYVLFLDGDDYLGEGFIEDFLAAVNAHHPDAIYWPYDHVDEQGRVTAAFPYKAPNPLLRSGIVVLHDMLVSRETRVCTISIAIRRNLIQNSGLQYTEDCRYGEDAELIFKALAGAKTALFAHKLKTLYLQRETSAMGKYTVRKFDSVPAMQRVRDYLAEFDDSAYQQLTSHFDNDVILHYYTGNYRLCLQHLVDAEGMAPAAALKQLNADIDSVYPNLRQQMQNLMSDRRQRRRPDRLDLFRLSPRLYMRLSKLSERVSLRRKG